ncbi:MAG: formyltransferase family protein [Candidatus Nanohaloarchaea archaeon]
MTLEAVFLGMNPAGEKVYEWLNSREDVEVKALLTEKEQLSLIKELQPEIVISAGFEHKVPAEIIDVPEKGIVNLHPSFLPYNRGAHPYIWPIAENTVAGVSIHQMVENIDEGPVIDRKEVRVEPDDTAEDLYRRLMFEQFEQFKDNWDDIREGVKGEEQRLKDGNVHYRDQLNDLAEIDLDEKVKTGELIDRLRALTFPDRDVAYFESMGERYYISIDITPERELD